MGTTKKAVTVGVSLAALGLVSVGVGLVWRSAPALLGLLRDVYGGPPPDPSFLEDGEQEPGPEREEEPEATARPRPRSPR